MDNETFNQSVERVLVDELDTYAPLEVESVDLLDSESSVDGFLELRWRDRIVPFRFETKSRSSPSLFRSVLERMTESISGGRRPRQPLLIVPYISDALVDLLMESEISALDLNGNFLILAPEMLAIRLDRPNQFTESRAIKKVYSYNSSIVGRFLLRGPVFPRRIGEIHDEIERLGGEISLSTVSKVLSGFAEDLIVEKSRSDGVRLLQPKRLLDNLRSEYREPRTGESLRLKLPEDEQERRELLDDRLDAVWMWTGASSAGRYSAAPMPRLRSIYTRDRKMARKLTDFEDEKFYNCTVSWTDDAFVYFDRRDRWASDVEACLALSQLDKRERETADQIARRILEKFDA